MHAPVDGSVADLQPGCDNRPHLVDLERRLNDRICTGVSPSGHPILESTTDEEIATIGVRPEIIDPLGGNLPGFVQTVEDTGPNRILLVDWSGWKIQILISTGDRFSAGDQIYPSINRSNIICRPRMALGNA